MADNTMQQLQTALTQLNTMLDDPTLKQGFSQIPDSIKSPIKDGLNKVLGVINSALTELKSKLGAVTTIQGLLGVINNLLGAAEGLAPGEKATLDQVKGIIGTLQALPDAQQIDQIITLIQQITGKLAAL